MFCPNCKKELEEVKGFSHYGSIITLNQCKNCGGIWFNNLELVTLEEEEAKKLEDIMVKNPTEIYSDNQKEKLCPLCKLPLLRLKDPTIPKNINIENCQKCGGFWMNRGETTKYKEYQKEKIKEESLESIEQKREDEFHKIIAKKNPELLLKLEEDEINLKSATLLGNEENKTEDMTFGKLVVKILAGIITLYFIISEAHSLLSIPPNTVWDNTTFFINILRFILIFIALPVLYLFKLLDYFGISWVYFPWRGGVVKSEYNLFQANLFYWAIYIIIFILIIIRLIGQTFPL